MIDATGILLIALTSGERKISSHLRKEAATANTVPMRNEIRIPIRILESVKRIEAQKDEVGIRERSASNVLNGEGRKISSPTRRERINHIPVHTKMAKR